VGCGLFSGVETLLNAETPAGTQVLEGLPIPMPQPTQIESPILTESAPISGQAVDIIDCTHTLMSESPPYNVVLTWPNLSAESAHAAVFNGVVNAWASAREAEFIQAVTDLDFPGALDQAAVQSTFMMAYDVTFSSPDLVSIQIQMDEYLASAAHPGVSSKSLNFDPNAGKWVILEDLFLPGTEAAVVLLPLVEPELIGRDIGYWPGSAETALQEHRNWNILATGLRFNFDNQVSPYAGGSQSVLILWADLADRLDPEGPAGWFLVP